MRKFRWYAAKYGGKSVVSRSWGAILDFSDEYPEARFKGHRTKEEAIAWVQGNDGLVSLEKAGTDLLKQNGYDAKGER